MDNPSNKLWLLPIIILGAIITEMASTDILLPSLPLIQLHFHTTSEKISFIISGNLLGLGLSGLIYGWLSDRFGRRIIYIIGNIIFFIGGLFCLLAPTINSFILARFIQGSGGGACASVGLAILKDSYSETRYVKIVSWIGILLSASPAIFPLLGGFLTVRYFWQVSLYLVAAVSLIIIFLIYLYLPETNQRAESTTLQLGSFWSLYISALSNVRFIWFALISALTYASIWVFLAILPLFIVNVAGYKPITVGLLLIINIVAGTLGTLLHNQLVGRCKPENLLLSGIILLLISSILFAATSLIWPLNIWLLAGVTSIYWMGTSFVFPNASDMALNANAGIYGIASSALISFEMLAGSIAISIGTYAFSKSMLPVAIISLILSLLTLVGFRLAALTCEQQAS